MACFTHPTEDLHIYIVSLCGGERITSACVYIVVIPLLPKSSLGHHIAMSICITTEWWIIMLIVLCGNAVCTSWNHTFTSLKKKMWNSKM